MKLLKCLVDDTVVDISFNQIGGLCTLNFLEAMDRKIGGKHLFKRSIILVGAVLFPVACVDLLLSPPLVESVVPCLSTSSSFFVRLEQCIPVVFVCADVFGLLQIKAWCYYESRVLGAQYSLLSTYALETMVLYIFNVHHACLCSPLEVGQKIHLQLMGMPVASEPVFAACTVPDVIVSECDTFPFNSNAGRKSSLMMLEWATLSIEVGLEWKF